mgnify:CR=1 FL=1
MADTLNYKCPNCSAGLTFDSKSQKMKCEYCGSTYSLDELDKIAEQAEEVKEVKGDHWEGFEPEQWQSDEKSNMAVWSCPSCGAEILAEKTTGATVSLLRQSNDHAGAVCGQLSSGLYHSVSEIQKRSS